MYVGTVIDIRRQNLFSELCQVHVKLENICEYLGVYVCTVYGCRYKNCITEQIFTLKILFFKTKKFLNIFNWYMESILAIFIDKKHFIGKIIYFIEKRKSYYDSNIYYIYWHDIKNYYNSFQESYCCIHIQNTCIY